MAAIPKLISSELLVSVLFVPQCLTTDLADFGSTISSTRCKTFLARSPPIPRLIDFTEKKVLHRVGQRLRTAQTDSPITTTDAWDSLNNFFVC